MGTKEIDELSQVDEAEDLAEFDEAEEFAEFDEAEDFAEFDEAENFVEFDEAKDAVKFDAAEGFTEFDEAEGFTEFDEAEDFVEFDGAEDFTEFDEVSNLAELEEAATNKPKKREFPTKSEVEESLLSLTDTQRLRRKLPNLYNVAYPLKKNAQKNPFRPAIIFPAGRNEYGRSKYIQFNFKQLNNLVDKYAHGLSGYGIKQGERTLLMVPIDINLIALAFALVKIGAVPVFIDPGMGRKAFVQCVTETEATAFIGISAAHAFSKLFPKAFKSIKHRITVGKRWFWGGATLDELRSKRRDPFLVALTTTGDEAAIVFTSGSTGIPKGVVYLHGMFKAQIKFLRDDIGMDEGEIDMPGLPIFALFNPALGATTIIPDMDFRKPAEVNPAYLVEAIKTYGVTTSFGSPTIWKRVGQYCIEKNIKLPSIKRIIMAGAPVPPWLIEQFTDILVEGQVYTPFGATEALPITNISGSLVLAETAKLTQQGWGVCVGKPLKGLTVRIINLTDEAIAKWDNSLVLPAGELGEIVVKGKIVTLEYLNRPLQTAQAKIQEEDDIWHRMGDVGYFDNWGRLWVCGRKSHRVETKNGLMLPISCEAIFNAHPQVSRTALVGIGAYGQQHPVLVVELKSGQIPSGYVKQKLIAGLLTLGREYEHTQGIQDFLFHKSFPVDVRHNVKIQREKLAVWAKKRVG